MKTARSGSLLRSIIWLAIYCLLVLLPLLSLVFSDTRAPGTGFWWDFSIGLGLAAASLIHMMAVLTARSRLFSAPFGIDVLYYFHRLMAILIFILVFAHPLILYSQEPLIIYKFEQPDLWSMLAGVAAWAAVVLLVVSALVRRLLGFEYDNWRRFHAVVGALALVLSFAHMGLIDYYTGTSSQFAIWSVYAAAWFALLVYVRIAKPMALLRRPYQLKQVCKETDRAYTISIEPAGHKGVSFMPGQFAWLSINRSPLDMADHPFSFSSSAASPGCLQFTIKELGNFTRTIKQLKPGDRVYVDGPFGTFCADRYPASGYVFVVGGIGIAPVMSMLRTFADRGDKRPLKLFFANKSPDTAIFHDEILSLQSSLNLDVILIYADPPGDWQGEQGLVDEHVLAHHLTGNYCQWHYFICGPVPMMKLVERSLYDLGVPYRQVHSEIYNLV